VTVPFTEDPDPIRPLSSGQASIIDFLKKKVNAFGCYWHTVAGFIF